MAPRTRPEAKSFEHGITPADEQRVRAGIEASERDDAMALTLEEAERYYASGVLPERATTWAASRG